MNNIFSFNNCYGCGVCTIICPKQIINIELNVEGFYAPVLVKKECTNCGLCLSVCAYNDKLLNIKKEIKSFAAWSNDEKVKRITSSGGIGFEIGKLLIKNGYGVCGVKYNPNLNRAEHFIATTIEEFIPSVGSKYIQSYTLSGFSHFKRNNKYFVTGTPCQIGSLRRYIRKMKIEDDFVLMDFFCHGIPSMNMWTKYTEMVETKIGKISFVSWRNKKKGWHDSYAITAQGTKREKFDFSDNILKLNHFSLMSKGDLFFKFFLSNICLGMPCYDCKYKMTNSAADIRVGDLWGKKYRDNDGGISALLVMTEKGNEVISTLEGCTLKDEDISVVTEGQMKVSPKKTKVRRYLLKAFNSNWSIEHIYKLLQCYLFTNRLINKFFRILNLKKWK
jgi:coenzyme F420-reducing hydrogenase beta subunit